MKLGVVDIPVSQLDSLEEVRMALLFIFILAYSSIASSLGSIRVILQLISRSSHISNILHDIRLL